MRVLRILVRLAFLPLLVIGAVVAMLWSGERPKTAEEPDSAVMVDPEARPIEGWPKCTAGMVSFRDGSDGWLSDSCGRMFRSSDGGQSWRRDFRQEELLLPDARRRRKECEKRASGAPPAGFACELVELVWLNPSTGIALADGVTFLQRTSDSGRTWKRRPLPGGVGYVRLERFGDRLWVYGAHLARSDDLGESWRPLPAPMTGALPFAPGLSFVTRDRGWLGSLAGTLWETADGGESWRVLAAPASHGEVLRLTPEHGWVSSAHRSVLESVDAGKTWTSHRAPPDDRLHPVRRSLPGIRLPAFFDRPTSPAAEAPPLLDHRFFAVGDDGVGQSTAPWLSWYRGGQLVSRAPPLETRSPRRLRLEGLVESVGGTRLGWSGDALFRSEDGGISWFRSGTLPERIERMRGLRDGAFVARGRSGAIYRAEYAGDDWSRSSGSLDAHLLEPLGPAVAAAPIASDGGVECLTTERGPGVTVEFGPTAEKLQSLQLTTTDGGNVLQGRLHTDDGGLRPVTPLQLTPDQARAVRVGLLAALLQPPQGSCNIGDAQTVATVRVRCVAGAPEETMDLVAAGSQAECNDSASATPTYHPAIGVGEFATEALGEAERLRAKR